ncbi:hypothetical protein IFM89_020055 [Coptis chinensis]|uniref:Uncharacterized protein n=1 Tax=Coptis chinensis TaxID=261450 RepID=A0A835IXI4_9MAGN|nr:hypothetical protein IFM89_020055 [Coptis chinensis]
MSPSASGISHSSMAWPQPNVPTLHLPGSNLQSSRLRSSLNARDIQVDDFSLLGEFEAQQQHQHQELLNELSFSLNHGLFGGLHSPGRMSPRSMEPISPMSARAVFSQREELPQHCLSSRDLGSNLS